MQMQGKFLLQCPIHTSMVFVYGDLVASLSSQSSVALVALGEQASEAQLH